MVNVILVRTQFPENIGFVSRSMQNMGAERLVLVDPQCVVGERATATAASGSAPLKNHIFYKSWKEFTEREPHGNRLAFTCRSGQFRPVNDFEIALKEMSSPTHLIFGPENNGLSNEELLDCHLLCSLPIFGPIASMNLSHAVMLALFILAREKHASAFQSPEKTETSTPFPNLALRKWLEVLGYDLSGQTNAYSVLRQLFQTTIPTPKQLVVLEKVLQQNIRKLSEIKPHCHGN
ncbi:MAG: hypothetical protein A4S09_00910 [Proteobacteria bacterium SG_bin7]|nr:MAG: hypothetical protein A4S09_00910 [Proteobacteria bacterium SG_bin7]